MTLQELFNKHDIEPNKTVEPFLDKRVVIEMDSTIHTFPGNADNVFTWWILETGHTVGWNESPKFGWTTPMGTKEDVDYWKRRAKTDGVKVL